MQQQSNPSTYFFVGRLSSISAFQVQQEPLQKGFFLEVFLEGIAIWGISDKPFADIYPEVKDIFDTLIAAYTFKTKERLSYTLESWIETKDIASSNNMVGWILKGRGVGTPRKARSKVNTPWKKAALFHRTLLEKGNINHRLALKDYYHAFLDTSDDAFLFAYRSIEDICRAITGTPDVNGKAWKTMHMRLGTSKTLIDPLTEIATCVRHGDKNNSIVIAARQNRDHLIDIAHQVILKEMKMTFPKFCR
jgi:hypothetical protein